MPQDLVAEKATPVSYGFILAPTIMIVALIILMFLAIAYCKRRVQHGGIFYIRGS